MQPQSALTCRFRWVMMVLVAAALMTSVWSLWRVALVAWAQIPARYDLIYESPNLATVLLIKARQNIYHPDVYERGEFVLTLYPPAFYYLVAALPLPRDRPFLPGRVVAASFMTLAGCLVFVIGRRRRTWLVPILALSLFFSFRGVIAHTVFYRHDTLGLFFSAAAVVLLGTQERGLARVLLAAVCGCLAIFTKQTYLTGLVSGFIFLAAVDRRRAVAFAVTAGAILLAGGLFAQIYWGSGFWFSTLVAPRNVMMWKQFWRLWRIVLHQPSVLFVMALAGVVLARSIYRDRWRFVFDSPYFIYMAVTTAVLMATVGKAGSALNYFIEPFLACLLWLTFSLPDPAWGQNVRLAPILGVALFLICECADLAFLHPPEYYVSQGDARASEEHLDRVRAEVESLGIREPKILNLARVVRRQPDRMEDAYLDPRVIAVNDSFQYMSLWWDGTLSPEPLRDAVLRRQFDVVLVPCDFALHYHPAPNLRGVVAAVKTGYHLARGGEYHYYVR